MKKTTMIIALFLSMASIANAQESTTDKRENLQIGAKAGMSYSNVYDADGDSFNADAKIGLTAGAFLRIPISELVGIQPELLITQKGFRGNGALLGNPYTFKRRSTFLDIPILVAFKPSEYITFLAGPQYSYLLQERNVFTSSSFSYVQEQEFKQDNIRKNIFGIVGGVDINLNHLVISGRIGLDVLNNRSDGSTTTPRYKNLSSQLTIGYKL